MTIDAALALLAEPRVVTVAIQQTERTEQILAPVYARQGELTEQRPATVVAGAVGTSVGCVVPTLARTNAAEQRARAIQDLVDRMMRLAECYGPDAVEAAVSTFRQPSKFWDTNKAYARPCGRYHGPKSRRWSPTPTRRTPDPGLPPAALS